MYTFFLHSSSTRNAISITLSLDNGHATFGAYLFLGRIILFETCVANRADLLPIAVHATYLRRHTHLFLIAIKSRNVRVLKQYIREEKFDNYFKKKPQNNTHFLSKGKFHLLFASHASYCVCRLIFNVRNLVKYLATHWIRAHFLQRPILF